MNLLDIAARYQRLPQSENIEDRRASGPDPLAFLGAPLSIGSLYQGAREMGQAPPNSLAALAGLYDIRTGNFGGSRLQQHPYMSPMDEFTEEADLMRAELGAPRWMQDRRR